MVAFRDRLPITEVCLAIQLLAINVIPYIKTLQCQEAEKQLNRNVTKMKLIDLIGLFYYSGHEELQVREKQLLFEEMNYIVMQKQPRLLRFLFSKHKMKILQQTS